MLYILDVISASIYGQELRINFHYCTQIAFSLWSYIVTLRYFVFAFFTENANIVSVRKLKCIPPLYILQLYCHIIILRVKFQSSCVHMKFQEIEMEKLCSEEVAVCKHIVK